MAQWNPLLRSPNGPKQFGRINGVAVVTRFFCKKMYGGFCQAAKKSGRSNEVTVYYYQGGRFTVYKIYRISYKYTLYAQFRHDAILPGNGCNSVFFSNLTQSLFKS